MAKDNTRINNQIKEKEVRLIGKDGEQIGVVSISEAMKLAETETLDLVEISPTASPVVCKLLDYGKYRYEKEKRDKEAKRNQKIVILKEVKVKPRIDKHDLDFKIKNIQKFLSKDNKVKVTLLLFGRERAYEANGLAMLNQIAEQFEDIAQVEKNYRASETMKNLILTPKK